VEDRRSAREAEARLPTVDDVLAARGRISTYVRRTPLVPGFTFDGCEVWLKLENLQETGAFKLRGSLNRVLSLAPEERARGLVTASSGNHALGLSRSCAITGDRVTVVVPEGSPRVKVEGCRALGAEVVVHGEAYDDACEFATRKAEEEGLTYVQSFDDPYVVAGQGTIGLEVGEDLEGVELVVCPVGGGGLASGLAVSAQGGPLEGGRIVGVEAEGAACMLRSLEAGRPVRLQAISTLADGIATKEPGSLTYRIVERWVERVVTVSDEEMLRACGLLMMKHKVVAELAGAAPVAAVLAGRVSVSGLSRAVCVISGGNIAPDLARRAIDAAS